MNNLAVRFSIIAAVLCAFLLFTGCEGSKNNGSVDENVAAGIKGEAEITGEPDPEAPVIRLGMMSSSDVIPFVLINEKKLAQKYGFELELETFTSTRDRDAALQAGELDGVLTDYIGVCMYNNAGLDVRITGITDGDYILVAGRETGITGISQIKGKSIAISENTLIEYTLDTILVKKGMSADDVVKEIVPRIPDRLELLRNGKIDLGLMPEPFSTLALNGGAVYLGSANECGLYPAVSAFLKTVLDDSITCEAVRNLYSAYDEAVRYMNETDVSEYEQVIIKAAGYPAEMAGKIEIKRFRLSALPPDSDVEDAVRWAAGKGLCSLSLDYNRLVYDVNNR